MPRRATDQATPPSRTPKSSLTLEGLLTNPLGFGLTTASPVQRAICRIADGLPLGSLASEPAVRNALGDVAGYTRAPSELYVLSGIRTGKSLLAAALAVRATQTCDLTRLRFGETPRVSVLSLSLDLGRVIVDHLVGTLTSRPALKALLVGDPTGDTVVLRHPSRRPIEIKVVAGHRAGASLVARWSCGVIFDEAPRMLGQDDGVVNFDDARRAAIGRLLPGAQLVAIGSPWAPRGPIYNAVQEHWGKPSRHLVVIRAPAPDMNPAWWTPERVADVQAHDDVAYRTAVLGEFTDPESSLLSSDEVDAAMRSEGSQGFQEGHEYIAAMDPATRGNAWTLVVATQRGPKRVIVMAKQWQGTKAAPLNPETILKEVASILRGYKVDYVFTDQWGFDAHRSIAQRFGLSLVLYQLTAAVKVDLFETLRIRFAQGEVELPNDPQVRADLLSVRRRVTLGGMGVTFDLPRTADGRHADYVPPLAMVCMRHVDAPEEGELVDADTRMLRERLERRERERESPWWETMGAGSG